MSFTHDFFVGIATHLAADGVGVYKPSSAYATTDTAITSQVLPTSPDNALAITIYGPVDDVSLSDSEVSVQIMSRTKGSDTQATNDLSDAVFGSLQSLTSQTMNGIYVQLIRRVSGVLLGKDDNQRWIRSDNFKARVYWPGAHRL